MCKEGKRQKSEDEIQNGEIQYFFRTLFSSSGF